MGVKLGPVLSFRGLSASTWNVGALVVVESSDPAPLMIATSFQGGAEYRPTAKLLNRYPASGPEFDAWRFDLGISLTRDEQQIAYSVNGQGGFSFWVPARGQIPTSAYASCNGFSHWRLLNRTPDPQALWRHLRAKHVDRPFHLLMMGGAQVYADSMWETVPELRDWAALPLHERRTRKFNQILTRQLDRFYAELYPSRWSQAEVRTAFASIPTIMMWDDHDIFEGWGSHDEQIESCEVFLGIFRMASRYFALYQQQLAPGEKHPMAIRESPGYSLGFHLGPLNVLTLDMRSERASQQVLSFASWKSIFDWLERVPAREGGGPTHLFILANTPVVYPDASFIGTTQGSPTKYRQPEDDLPAYWASEPHKEERLRLIHRLLDFSRGKRCRVTLLCGDLHAPAIATVRSTRPDADPRAQSFNQLNSSGIVHPPPASSVHFCLDQLIAKRVEDSEITSEMTCLPGSRHCYIGARNWLSLEPDFHNRVWTHWNVEGAKYALTKVIHPIGFVMPSALERTTKQPS